KINKFIVKTHKTPMTNLRKLQSLRSGTIDVIALPTSKTLEAEFLPIRFPLMRGLLGYRALLENKDYIKGKPFKSYRFGQGRGWTDVKILENNGFNVVLSQDYASLFPMLNYRRIDFFPRGVSEALNEYKAHHAKFKNIAINKHYMLYYPFVVYFFVKKEDVHLHDSILAALNNFKKSGEFEKYFQKHNGQYVNYIQKIFQAASINS
ncbi:hypothetical protein BGC07_00875, partial [Piscirickettsia litoralis]